MVAHDDFSLLAAEFPSALRFVVEVEVSGYWITLSGLAYLEVCKTLCSLLLVFR